jgi:pullulanase/glycogen debranching enzyme
LLDPYAKTIAGAIRWSDALFGHTIGHPDADLSRDERDSAAGLPKCVVVDPAFSWGDDAPPRTPWHKTLIYELHVKGFTARHPHVPPELRGTYAGLTCPPVIDYLQSLGITAVELMPVHQFVADKHLVDRGSTNYWGYNSIGFFAPDARFTSGGVLGASSWSLHGQLFKRFIVTLCCDVESSFRGDAIEEVDARGNRIVDDTLLILLNAHYESIPFILPAHRARVR